MKNRRAERDDKGDSNDVAHAARILVPEEKCVTPAQ
jgi:hypothetical protein